MDGGNQERFRIHHATGSSFKQDRGLENHEFQRKGGEDMTQKDAVLEYLLTGASITPYDALRVAGSLRLSERIRELEAEGVSIVHSWLTVGKKRVMSYRLAV